MECFLQQNAFHKDDTFVSMEKQYKMMRIILHLHHAAQRVIAAQVPISKIIKLGLFDSEVLLHLPGGDLKFNVYEKEEGLGAFMEGPAQLVFDGEIQ